MTNPVVSVVMPCYNQALYIKEAIESLQGQTLAAWECIIVNDGSSDNTEEVALNLCKQDARIKYIRQKNGGPSSARNNGISVAKGQYILPLDADDLIEPEYLSKAHEAFRNNENLSLVYCEAEFFGSKNGHWALEEYSYKTMLRKNIIFCSAIFYKADWERAGGYDESLKQGWEDWEFWVRMLNADSKVYRIPEVLFYYRIKSLSRNTNMDKAWLSEDIFWYIYSTNYEKYKQHYPNPINLLNTNFYLEEKLNEICASKSYRVGNFLLKPISFLKRLQKARTN